MATSRQESAGVPESAYLREYRRKTENTVKAVQLREDNAEEVAMLCGGQIIEETKPGDPSDVYVGVNVPSLTGNFRLSQGDYLVKHPGGNFTKVAEHVFEDGFVED